MKLSWFLSLAVLLSLCATPGRAEGRPGATKAQTSATSVPSAPAPVAFALDTAVTPSSAVSVAADFNGDGKMDVAYLNGTTGGVTIRLGKGDGTFEPAKNYRVGYYYNAMVAGDFNGDGKIDLAVSLPTLCGGCGGFPSYQLQMLVGAGDGSFTAVVPKYPFYGMPLAAGDFNGDGKLDLIVTSTDYYGEDWSAAVVFGKGNGLFEQGTSLVDTFFPTHPAVGDFNGDGKLDIAMPALDYCCGDGNPILYVFLGNGDGTFAAPAQYPSPQYFVSTAAVGDFNGDGKLDIVTDSVQILLNNGDGTFTNDSSVNLAVTGYNASAGVVVGDFNGDGKLDFATQAATNPFSTYVFLGESDSSDFTLVQPSGTHVLQAVDFNGDGKLDLLTTGGIYLQTPASLQPVFFDFGVVAVNSKTTQSFTVTNIGSTGMPIKSIQLSGSGVQAYSQTNNCGTLLRPGHSCQVQVVFQPTAQAAYNVTLNVAVPSFPASTVTLVGIGN